MYSILSDGTRDYFVPESASAPLDYIPDRWERVEQKKSTRADFTKGTKVTYYNLEPIFIDTETSHIGEEFGWVYQWAARWGKTRICGRNARELGEWLTRVAETVQHGKAEHRVFAYIHNQGYDWNYIRDYLPPHEVFAVKPHKVLTARWRGMEIRCSYLLTNNALGKWADNSKAAHRKLSGAVDYDIVRTPRQPLTETEWAYQWNDVDAMYDSWHFDRANDRYKSYNVPLTSTGFVREHVRQLAQRPGWQSMVQRLTPDYEWYCHLQAAYMAGYTHGNRFKGQTVWGQIGHRDFTSSFPARMVLDDFPMGEWHEFRGTLAEVEKTSHFYAYCLVLRLTDMHLKSNRITAPLLSYSHLTDCEELEAEEDNGRVLRFTGTATYTVTEIDYELLKRQYDGKITLVKAMRSRKDKLPQEYRDLVMTDFYNKTNLDPKINPQSDEVLYLKSKNRLNSYYGMCCQKTVQPESKFDPDSGEWSLVPGDIDDYQKRTKKLVVPFCWGVWIVAHARAALIDAIETVGYDKWLYADTDSIFYIMTPENEAAIEAYNQRCIERAKEENAYCGRKYLGGFVMEGDAPCQAMKQLHAKCYAYITKDGKLKVTVAGVNRERLRNPDTVTEPLRGRCKEDKYGNVIVTNAAELGNIDRLEDGFIFAQCGGTKTTYVTMTPHIEIVNGDEVEVASAAIITDTTYKVTDTRARGRLEDIEEIFAMGDTWEYDEEV